LFSSLRVQLGSIFLYLLELFLLDLEPENLINLKHRFLVPHGRSVKAAVGSPPMVKHESHRVAHIVSLKVHLTPILPQDQATLLIVTELMPVIQL
jgi:hypothetical protein